MLFNSFEFIFFFIGTVILYYLLPHKYRWILLLGASYYFYYAWEPKLTLLLMASTLVDYFCGIQIYQSKRTVFQKLFLIVSIGVNLALLIFFKYLGFFTEVTLDVFRFFGLEVAPIEQVPATYNLSRILLPIGISFYTFQTLSYSIDIYRGHMKPEHHLGQYALFVAFFPQLVAGPIERAKTLVPQLRNKIVANAESIKKGLMLMAWGFFMKMVVADRLGGYVDTVFKAPQDYPGIPLILGAYFFTFQIYFDFAAYSIIAIGAARVLGFHLMTNFNRPLFGKDANEFWRRWHISLMTWLRDYLYRPLVKGVKLNKAIAVFIVFTISGLWHGASWNFVIWGTLNGMLLIFENITRNFRKHITHKISRVVPPEISRFLWWLIVFHYIVLSLIFFRTGGIKDAYTYFYYLSKVHSRLIAAWDTPLELALSFFFIIVVQVVHYFKPDHKVYELVYNKSTALRWTVYIAFIFILVFFTAVNRDPFIYFQF